MTRSPWTLRAGAGTLPAADRTGAIRSAGPAPRPVAEDIDAMLGAIGRPRTYTVADLQAAYSRELSAGRDSDDAAERIARDILR